MADGKVDTRIKRSRTLLQNAIIDLILERGYDHITVQDITKQANLNRSTFYLHYKDKEDLLQQTMQEVLSQLQQCFTPPPHGQLQSEEPYPGFINLFEHVAENASFYRVMLGDKGTSGFYRRLMRVVQASYGQIIDSHKPSEQWDVPIEFFTHYLSSAHLGVLTWWVRTNMPYTPRYMAIQLTRLTKSTANDMEHFTRP